MAFDVKSSSFTTTTTLTALRRAGAVNQDPLLRQLDELHRGFEGVIRDVASVQTKGFAPKTPAEKALLEQCSTKCENLQAKLGEVASRAPKPSEYYDLKDKALDLKMQIARTRDLQERSELETALAPVEKRVAALEGHVTMLQRVQALAAQAHKIVG